MQQPAWTCARSGSLEKSHRSLVGLRRLLHPEEMACAREALYLRSRAKMFGQRIHCDRLQRGAPIVDAMKVEDRLRNGASPCRYLLLNPVGRAKARWRTIIPVVSQGSLEVFRTAQAFLGLGKVVGRVVSRRPVTPQPVNEHHIVGGDDAISGGHLEEPEVEGTLNLFVCKLDATKGRYTRND